MAVWKHRILEQDPVARTGVCEACGPVDLKRRTKSGKEILICMVAHRERRRAETARRRRRLHGEPGPVCEICSKPCKTHWDHDHATGAHRGWLCNECNLGLGLFHDSPEALERAARYLRGEL